jgi:hypothetical protein
MITRKAITTAFEVITEDRNVKTITVFCPNRPSVSVFRMQRVRVTRVAKHDNSYRVELGRLNYAELKYVESQISKKLRVPTMFITYRKAR